MSPAPFKVRSEQEDGVFVITVEGELDMNTATDLEHELEGPVAAGQAPLLIDLSRCEFIDSTGIALIVRAWQRVDASAGNGGKGGLVLCCRNEQVRQNTDPAPGLSPPST